MSDWFDALAAGHELPKHAVSELAERGFVVLPCVLSEDRLEHLIAAYTDVMTSATGDDIRVGSTSTKVSDLVNRGPVFDQLYLFPPLLGACCQVIGSPFKLSSLLARTLRPGAHAQELHVDVERDSTDWPLLGFILMVDDFRPDNGATRFVPGSHRWSGTPEGTMPDAGSAHEDEVLACGPAGSMLLFDGSTWHGHTANISSQPRRSIQGAFIPHEGRAATDFSARMLPETRARLSSLGHTLLALNAEPQSAKRT
jgi:ectoine hydroxylase-related dioxygenase (phytanoyl-CoA dioxygenase family)